MTTPPEPMQVPSLEDRILAIENKLGELTNAVNTVGLMHQDTLNMINNFFDSFSKNPMMGKLVGMLGGGNNGG